MWTRPTRPAGLLAGWLVLSPLAALAQTPSSPPSERGASAEIAPPSFRDELKLFAYIEQSFRDLWGAYDFTERLRVALRQEYFKDAQGAGTGFDNRVSLWTTTVTLQYRIWRGLVGRVEYRHDQADEKVFRARYDGNHVLASTARSMDTFSLSMYSSFF